MIIYISISLPIKSQGNGEVTIVVMVPVYERKELNMRTVRIVDDIMGSGKSTWAINYINKNPDKKFLCIVPLLEECKRYINSTNVNIVEPVWGSKWMNFKWLIESEQNIVTTHALIQKMDLEMLELLKSKQYTLLVDECLEVLSPYKMTPNDIRIIFNEKLVYLDDSGFLIWNEDKESYKGVYSDIKRLCELKSLMGLKKEDSDELARILMWNFPVDFFKCFNESFIFTYLWDGSIQKSYFDIHKVPYEKYMLDKGKLVPYDKALELKKRQASIGLIHIYEGKFNEIGEKIGKSNSLSKSWYLDKKRKKSSLLQQLKSNTENYFRTVTRTPSTLNMYTVFKSYKKCLSGRGYSRGFVSCNAKGTNLYDEKAALAYLINFFITPEMKQFINYYRLEFDEDLFALSALLQWIWRSRIRKGKPIQLYIPSERMRRLLKEWCAECEVLYSCAA